MTDLVVHPAPGALRGMLPSPPDPTSAEIALVLGALSEPGTTTRIRGRGLPSLAAVPILRRLGADPEPLSDGWGVTAVERLTAPVEPMHGPASAEALGLLVGVLAAQPFPSVLAGPEGLIVHHLGHIASLLRARGARLEGPLDPARPGALHPPVEVAPATLSELSWEVQLGERGTKAAALGSGLFATGPTLIHEPVVSADRCERQLRARGADLSSVGPMLQLAPLSTPLTPASGPIPGDGASAAVLATAALAVPGSRIGLGGTTVTTSRSGWLEALRDAGATMAVAPGEDRLGESVGDLHLDSGPLRPIRLGGERAARAGATLATLAAMAAFADGESLLSEVPVAHPREPSRVLGLLDAFGVDAAPTAGGIAVRGGPEPLRPCEVPCEDADTAMAATVLALRARDRCRIAGADPIVARFPRFVGCLRALGARIDVTESG